MKPAERRQEGPEGTPSGLPFAPANYYRRGRVRELLARRILEEAGYFVVRSHISRGPADLVALRAGQLPLLIQVRTGIHGLRPAERFALWTAARQAGGLAIIANVSGRPMAVTFAVYSDGSSNREPYQP